VEGNGPVKPGNPLSNVASRVPIPVGCPHVKCDIPQDEGNSNVAAPLIEGLFCYLFPGIVRTLQLQKRKALKRKSKCVERLQRVDDDEISAP
jgi:hypothetical protein